MDSLICDECMAGMTPGSVHSTVTETSFIGGVHGCGRDLLPKVNAHCGGEPYGQLCSDCEAKGASSYEVVFYFCSEACAVMRMSSEDPRETL